MSKRKAEPVNGSDAGAAQTTDALDALDPLLQHRSRLGAMVLLSTAEGITFTKLRQLLTETDGNLGAQLRKLEDAKYVLANKTFIDRKPTTQYSITKAGHAALKRHLDAIDALIRKTKGG
jgi:DNA-binding MarR family transcriptional regulator